MTASTKSHIDDATDAVLAASRALVAVSARSMAGIDVTLPQFRTLVVLASGGPSTSGELAANLGVHSSTMTRMVDRLEARHLVTRSGTGDRREVRVTLAPAGRRTVDAVTTARRSALGDIVGRLSQRDQSALIAAFTAFAAAAGEIPDAQWPLF